MKRLYEDFAEHVNKEDFKILLSNTYEINNEGIIKPPWISDKNAWNC